MQLVFKLKKTPEFIFDYLTDMQKFASVHPVISKIEFKGDNNYLVHETLKIAFIPISFTYPVKIEKDFNNKAITMSAVVAKMTKIEMKFSLKEEDGYTVVTEDTSFKSPLPVKSTMENIFRKQHTELFRRIDLK